ncbi:MAG TPA: ATP-binding protein [Phycisphaerae bacterium]|nr:ATP-binding protein [Phycisphaerae bacterium]
MPTLHVLRGADKGQTFRTTSEPAVLGRESDQIALSDISVSRRHAELRPENGTWTLRDLSSSNGTYLNGVRISDPVSLKHGDQIKLGGTLLVFSGDETTEQFIGAAATRDMVEFESGGGKMDSSILSAIPGSDDSLILAAPETADAVHAWKVMYRLAELLGVGLAVEGFLERVTDILLDNMVVDRVFVLMRDQESGELMPQVVRYRGKSRGKRPRITTSRTIVQHVLDSKEGILCANAMTDERFADPSQDANQDSVHRLGLRSVICVPILAHDLVQGVIHLDCSMSRHTYTNEQLRLATAIGRMAGMAIENTRLLESRLATERLAAVGEAVAHLSHHIRNILQGMGSGADVLEMGLRREDLETIRSGWKIMQTNVDRTFQLATNMLTFSKKRNPAIEMGQLNQVVQDAIKLMQRRADAKSVMLLTELADDLPAIPLDMEGMSQVAVNVLSNAVDAVAAQTGRVNVRTSYDPAADRVTLSIRDNGPGIPPDQIEHVFQAFHSTKGYGGTGLGLAAARKVVDELGGEIDVESPPNEGTTFHIHVPTSRVELADSEETHGPAK